LNQKTPCRVLRSPSSGLMRSQFCAPRWCEGFSDGRFFRSSLPSLHQPSFKSFPVFSPLEDSLRLPPRRLLLLQILTFFPNCLYSFFRIFVRIFPLVGGPFFFLCINKNSPCLLPHLAVPPPSSLSRFIFLAKLCVESSLFFSSSFGRPPPLLLGNLQGFSPSP